ncbi:SMI1/KNR4 family protein [uncultured Psychroserpens sp.]|uniref:SMI1/KNR4 family protein n=1 Tax=uncultured Psychroserpens sp. TaxID=255436 RepID=UPI00262E93C6|nr:SMI1/KNR4 family protein [uncultured Psychroserpens sp.]
MTNLEIINKLKASTFVDEDGEIYQLEFQDGLTDSEIEQLKEQFPNKKIDNQLIEILKQTKGWDGYGPEMVYFDSIGDFGFWELSANSITLGHDGFGNHWILDLNTDGELGKVFFACHDPAVFVVHSQSLNEYLKHLLEFYERPDKCHMTEIHYKTTMTIWNQNKLCTSKTEFENKYPKFRDFLAKFDGDEWTVADLRTGQNKDGFAWGKLGSNQFTERHPNELIWVIKNKKKGFLSRLFGK